MNKSMSQLAAGMALIAALSASPALAQKKYDTGASDTEIKIGQTAPFSGPASAYATIAKAQAAYIKMINDQGGINGRKINLIQYDDAYSPPKTVEQVRKLVESDEVLLTFQMLGTPATPPCRNISTPRRCRSCSPPPARPLHGPANSPWTMGFNPYYQTEGRIYAQIHPRQPSRTPRSPSSTRTTTSAATTSPG